MALPLCEKPPKAAWAAREEASVAEWARRAGMQSRGLRRGRAIEFNFEFNPTKSLWDFAHFGPQATLKGPQFDGPVLV